MQIFRAHGNSARGLRLLIVLFGLVGALIAVWWAAVTRPELNFLPNLTPAEWIVYPTGPAGRAHPRVELSTVFRFSFALDAIPPQATIRVAGFHRYSITINGRAVSNPSRRGKNWKEPDLFVLSSELQSGTNEILVTVHNTNGPAALWFSLDAGKFSLDSGEAWEACCAGATWKSARLASKPMAAVQGNTVYGGERCLEALQKCWP